MRKTELDPIVVAIASLFTIAEQGLGSRALVDQVLVLEATYPGLSPRAFWLDYLQGCDLTVAALALS